MRVKGITYDTGFVTHAGTSRESFDLATVKCELQIIHDDLHCNAVRVTGGDPDRIELAAALAAEVGLDVWVSPFTCDQTADELIAFLSDLAERAERLRLTGASVVFVTGAELSLFMKGILAGDTFMDRIALLAKRERLRELIADVPPRINEVLAQAVGAVRARFGGPVTYASIPFEGVDWSPFDFVGVDAYRSIEIADRYRDGIKALVAQGKPVIITEIGCATHRGAADKGARGWMIVDYGDGNDRPPVLNGEYVRDEAEQAQYLHEVLDVCAAEGVDGTFVFTFAAYNLPHRDDPRLDLDMGSYGVVKLLEGRHSAAYPDLAWEPKAAFAALTEIYREGAPQT